MMTETWRPVPDYGGRYEVSNYGYVRRVLKDGKTRLMANTPDSQGYLQVALTLGGRTRRHLVHGLVMRVFAGPPPFEGAEVNHRNLIKTDNRLINLEWATARANVRHALDFITIPRRGPRLTDEQVVALRQQAPTMTRRALAERYGLHRRTVSRIVNGGSHGR